ncbi:uncharacterized protein [Manis javanica]|uniref:uncharacterized protein isoform X1 n=1 Tax=Manis javanica TaxID=9974 RepID=UPI00187A54E0|nr:uncharacterized protein LOC108402613 isoform X1 [Manis javanica]
MLAAGSPHPARPSLRHQPLRSPTTRAPRSLLAQRAGGAAPPEGVHLSTASPPAQRPAHPALEPPRRFPHGCGLCKEQTKAARVSGRRVPASAATEEHARNGLPRPAPVSWVAARGERQPWLDHGVCGQGAGPGGGGGGELTAGWSLRLRAHWELRQPARALRRTADAAEGLLPPPAVGRTLRGEPQLRVQAFPQWGCLGAITPEAQPDAPFLLSAPPHAHSGETSARCLKMRLDHGGKKAEATLGCQAEQRGRWVTCSPSLLAAC